MLAQRSARLVPAGMAIDAGLLYFADEKNHRVRSITLSGGAIRNVAGNGVAGFSETDTIAASAGNALYQRTSRLGRQ